MSEQNCRACPSCWYSLKRVNEEGRHFLHCNDNRAVEDARGFAPVLMDRRLADGPLPEVIPPQAWCPRIREEGPAENPQVALEPGR
jgi:hypothetical protein